MNHAVSDDHAILLPTSMYRAATVSCSVRQMSRLLMYHTQHSRLSECGDVDGFGMFTLRPRVVLTNLLACYFLTSCCVN